MKGLFGEHDVEGGVARLDKRIVDHHQLFHLAQALVETVSVRHLLQLGDLVL